MSQYPPPQQPPQPQQFHQPQYPQPGQPFPGQGGQPGMPPFPPQAPPKKSNMKLLLIILGLVLCCGVGLIGVLAAIAVPNFLEAQVRSKVSRSRSDMRSFATAIESFYIDNNAYPPSTTEASQSIDASLAAAYPSAGWRGSFFPYPMNNYPSGSLTTPIAYITSHFPDPFASPAGRTFNYYSDDRGWIIWSPGPDLEYDLDWTVYDSSVPQPSDALLQYAYDPTNGTVSGGDVFRVKQ